MRASVFVVWVALLCAFVGLGTSSVVEAQPRGGVQDANEAQAREAFQRGRIHYDNGEFDNAAAAFEEAYKLSGRDALLYNLYLAYRDANQQEKAAEALENYLARVRVVENRAQLEARLKALRDGIAARKAAEAAAQQQEQAQVAPVVAEPTQDAAPLESEGPKRWWLVPTVVAGSGGVLMLGSLATGLMASSKHKELQKKCMDNVCDSSLKGTANSGKTLALVTDVLLFGGGALAVTGVVLLLLKKPKASEAPSAGLACTSRGCAGSVALRF
jgi:tetratricopeptide (TPR) repeat protein